MTWGNQPSTSGSVTDTQNVAPALACLNYAVTADVAAWIGGASNYGWRLTDPGASASGAEVDYASREHATSIRPLLTVTYATP
jgi:hypothetical protein